VSQTAVQHFVLR